MRRKIPPSRIRYDKANPTVSFRLTKDLKETLDGVRGDKSYAAFVKGLLLKTINVDAYKVGHDKGLREGFKEWGILFPCSVCNIDVVLSPDSDGSKAAIKYLRDGGWGHSTCIDK